MLSSTMRKYRIERPSYPFDGYRYNVQVLVSTDYGRTFCYCGIGRFCKTANEALDYIRKYNAECGNR